MFKSTMPVGRSRPSLPDLDLIANKTRPVIRKSPKFDPGAFLQTLLSLRKVSVARRPRSISFIQGYSPDREVFGVTFDTVTIEGKPLRSAEDADLYLLHARDVQFAP